MKIIVDAMGGDNAPESAAWGGALAAKEYGEEVLLVGDPDKVAAVLKDKGMEHTPGVTIMPASDLVDMHDDPATVLRHKPDSSMAVAFKLLKSGEGDALVSAGNTGALLTGATLYGGRIKGIRRGALAPVMPCKSGQVMLCDAGANTECTAEMTAAIRLPRLAVRGKDQRGQKPARRPGQQRHRGHQGRPAAQGSLCSCSKGGRRGTAQLCRQRRGQHGAAWRVRHRGV